MSIFIRCIIVTLLLTAWRPSVAEPITRIPAGTIARDSSAPKWNRLVLRAMPRIATGDVDSLSQSIRDVVASLHLTVMATVQPSQDHGRFRLAEVGIGYSTIIAGKPTVVDSESSSRLGADLGFFGRQMLSTNEEQLSKVRVVIRSTTLVLFDTPAIYHRHSKHESCIARHLIWIEPESGKLTLATWLLVNDNRGNLRPTTDPIRIVLEGTKEDRRIHVDGDAFNFLGVPSESAFAVENLPPGQDILWSDDLKAFLSHRSYDAKRLSKMTNAINQAVLDAR